MISRRLLIKERDPNKGASSYSERSRLFSYVALLASFDFIAAILSFFIPWFYRIGLYNNADSLQYPLAIALFLIIFFFLSFSENAYRESNFWHPRTSLYQSFKYTILTFGSLLVLAFLLKITSNFSRIWGVTWFLLFSSYIALSRFYVARLMRKLATRGIKISRAILVGDANTISSTCASLSSGKSYELDIVGALGDNFPPESGIRCLGGLGDIEKTIGRYDIDDVIIAAPWSSKDLIAEVVKRASRKAVNIYLAPEHQAPIAGTGAQKTLGTLSLMEIDRKPIERWQALLKRLEDIVLTLGTLAAIWPIMLITAILIKLESKGPVLFVQPRYGFNNELINILKFRSMYTDMSDQHAAQQTTEHDPRVTRVGRFIRKTSIDELPQLFNVLMGSMSLVGPRPHAKETKAAGRLFEDVVDNYAVRHRVRPGVTGWAQVNGWRGETDTEDKIRKRVEYDMYYIRNWSLTLDIFILIKTVYVVLFKTSEAY
ncbi:undecaprenyl-phosphate glucose phosphotransferase [Kordiimonas marina]|uniref:undecaprenyl-phosphate glucose phosphotransferase n=1 Tax=Kordiimonas marina TaxID=2872312 RepID=UPI001FF178A4|nr:undecaprenyl-phosphate glucose phosphotransferase [Kordiimonas marina]MCJ9429949.1 undecaprenyl-phosphate glucose phosphotransferase [Kordiimonas marina]